MQVFTPDGEQKREWTDKFYGPRGIAVDAERRRVRRRHRQPSHPQVLRGRPREGEWGGKGTEPGKFAEPVGVAVDKAGQVYVCDNGNARLQIFDPDGKLVGGFPVEQDKLSEPHVTVAPDGTVVSVPLPQVIRAYDRAGKVLREIAGGEDPKLPFKRPMGLTYDKRTNELVVVDLKNRVIRVPAK